MTVGGSPISSGLESVRKHPAVKVAGTRIAVALVVLLLTRSAKALDNPQQIFQVVLFYLVAVTLLVVIARTAIEQRRIRSVAILLDVLAISLLVSFTRGGESAWPLLYAFPIMSVSRYLGPKWSVAVALFASLGYGWANAFGPGRHFDPYAGAYITAMLTAVALTATKLARSRERVEARIGRTIDDIYRQLLDNHELPAVMHLILESAIKLTRSDMSAIAFVEGESMSDLFVVAGSSEAESSSRDAERILKTHYKDVLRSAPRALSLVNRPLMATFMGKRAVAEPPWAGRLIPLEIGGTPFGILGVFSRRSVHYKPDDLQKLSELTPLIAVARQSANLSHELKARAEESKARLRMLYQINGQLQTDQGLETLFQNVVELVSQRVGSEEAALFLPDDRELRLKKVAVAGPDAEITEKLRPLELYEEPASLTGIVFENKTPNLNNHIDPNEPHAADYSRELPSGLTRHHMGAPLLIGDEVLGVIRVLNKKAKRYDHKLLITDLDTSGFLEDDLELLTTIATYIASAIRNAMFIEKKQHFEDLVYKSPDPIIVIDGDGHIENLNKECENLLGLTEQRAIGMPVEKVYESPEHAREIGRALWAAKDHTIRAFAARVRDSDGSIIPIRLSANLLLDKNGRLVSSIGVFKDAREMIQGEETRTRGAKLAALGRLAQTTGHDIKHDIGAILNFVDVLEHGETDDATAQDMYMGIRAATTGAYNKLQNMLMTANPRPPDKQVASVRSVVDLFATSIAYRAQANRIDFVPLYSETDPLILADIEQMRQVFANLFGNSAYAINLARTERPSAGRISLAVAVDDDLVRLSWCDDGCGLADGSRTSMFTPFFTTKETGSGLGLFISRTIIENHGGTISIVSSDRKGTCFEILLPLFHDMPDLSSEELAAR